MVFVGLLLLAYCPDIVLTQHYYEDYDDTNSQIMEMYQKFGSHLFASPDYESGVRVANWYARSGVNPEELGNYVEGDIVFPNNISMARNGIVTLSSKWPHGIIPYTIAGRFSQTDLQTLKWAFAEYARLTCIKFVPRVNELDYIYIANDREGCYSAVGRVGGAQKINLQSPGCAQRGTVIHELMHVVGFFHEHTRWDRNRYVTIDYRNIIPGALVISNDNR
uniref:Metalloendopeptidase n=1 Tax=Rhodnius prolixus TaxID=13249 RepID=T1IDG8_RHOPR